MKKFVVFVVLILAAVVAEKAFAGACLPAYVCDVKGVTCSPVDSPEQSVCGDPAFYRAGYFNSDDQETVDAVWRAYLLHLKSVHAKVATRQ